MKLQLGCKSKGTNSIFIGLVVFCVYYMFSAIALFLISYYENNQNHCSALCIMSAFFGGILGRFFGYIGFVILDILGLNVAENDFATPIFFSALFFSLASSLIIYVYQYYKRQ
jgi:uncharacterized membrane protein YfcA